MKQTFSIRYKFLAASTLLLCFCVAMYLLMATTVFRRDKSDFVFDFNRSLVTNVASDIETVFQAATDKMRLVAYFFNSRDERSLNIVRDLLAASPEIVFVGGSQDFNKINRQFFVQTPFVETYALSDDFFTAQVGGSKPVPFEKMQTQGEAIWNATIPQGPPLIGYGKSVVIEDSKGRPVSHYAVVTYLKADRILKALTRSEFNPVFIVNQDGEVIAHPDSEMQQRGHDESLAQLIREALDVDLKTKVTSYQNNGEEYLGAFSKAFNNQIFVLSRVSAEAAFQVVDRFLFRSLMFALIVGTLAFIVAIFFSRSLTRPLEVLMGGMDRVAEGELTTQIHVQTRDEIAVLAESFNKMIRDLKQSREELEEINRELESKVKERTAQLERQNQAVKSAQEALLRTTRLAAVGEIAGRAAHEVLNPLTTIMGRLEKLQQRVNQNYTSEISLLQQLTQSWRRDYDQGGFDSLVKNWKSPSSILPKASLWEEDLKNLSEVEQKVSAELKSLGADTDFLLREAQRINRIIQSMRSLSVVKADKRELNLRDLLEESVNIMLDLASQYGIKVELECPQECGVQADPDEFVQALTNMIRNSIQAIATRKERVSSSPPGWIRIKVQPHEPNWRIELSDNGIGIEPENQDRLFESQFTTKPRQEGTGLGLNIARRFIRAIGGDITLCESQPNQGCTFWIDVPKGRQQGAAA